MLTVLPVRNTEARALYSEQCDDILLAEDGTLSLGYVAISVRDGCVEILALRLYDVCGNGTLMPIETADLLIRAAMSYGLNRNCIMIRSKETYPEEVFEQLGFRTTPGSEVSSAVIEFPPC